jgi:DNA-binding NtrC family response regulator
MIMAGSIKRTMAGKTFTIFMVDDDEDDYLILSLYCKQIESCQIHVEWVDTFPKAQRYLAQHTPDLLVVDYRLNGSITGLDLALEVKQNHPGLPAIMISAQDIGVIRTTRKFSILDGYIHKKDVSAKILTEVIGPFLV